jgi:hypothetical protein
MLDPIYIDELTLGADKSYLRFGPEEWYKYEPGNISYIRNPDWLEAKYGELKNSS